MSRLATIALIFSLIVPSNIKATEKSKNIGEMLTLYAAGTDQYKLMNRLLVGATGQALSWANSKLRVEGRRALYCAPDKLTMSNDQYILLLENAVQKEPALGSYPMNALGMIILDILIDTFPCSKK